MCHKETASELFALKCFLKRFTEGNDMDRMWGEIREGDKGRGTNKQLRAASGRRTQKVLGKGTKIKENLEVN